MAKVKLQANLSKNSLNNLIKEVELYGKNLQQGIKLGVSDCTELLYKTIIKKMSECNLDSKTDKVYQKYDKATNVGKVYTNDIVIMFHEFGTGIKGTQDDWANTFDYTVNASGKGESGWYFYNEEHNYGGITHGLTTKHIFYNSLLEVQKQIPKTIGIRIARTTGAMY